MRKKLIFSFFLFLLIFIYVYPTRAQIIGYTDDQVWTKLTKGENVLLIDMRSEESYLESHIPTAINIEFTPEYEDTLVQLVYSYEKSENIIYCSCDGGSSAKILVTDLKDNGYDDFYYMSDNFRDWVYETVSGSNPGSVAIGTNSSSNYTNSNINNRNNNPTIVISDLSPLNLALALIAVAIVIWKKKK